MKDVACHYCDEELAREALVWELLDGYARPYGSACMNCAEGAFDRYYESRVE